MGQPEIGWRRPWSRKTHQGLVNPKGARGGTTAAAAATGPRPEKESRSDLPKQPCRPLNQSGVMPEMRQTRAPTPDPTTPGDRRERGAEMSMSKRARPKQVSEATEGDGRERRRERDGNLEAGGRERNRRTVERKMQKSRNPFSFLSSLFESLFAVCTRALSLSLSLTRTGCCCCPSQQPPGPGRGGGGKRRVSRILGGGGRRLN